MRTVVYLDTLLLVNFLMAECLLTAAVHLAGESSSFGGRLLGSAAAAGFSLILLAPELPVPVQLAYRVVTCGASAALCCPKAAAKRKAAVGFWYALLNLMTAGGVILLLQQRNVPQLQTANLAVYWNVSPFLLLGCSGGCCLAVEAVLRFWAPVKAPTATVGVEWFWEQCQVRVRAALDTGCRLKEPISCQPVLLVSCPDAKARLPMELQQFLEEWFRGAQPTEPPPHLRMIPCTTATGKTLLPAVMVSDMRVITAEEVYTLNRSVVAFSGESFGDPLYEAVYGRGFLEREEQR